jgi:FkbM family methyltransferase
MSMGRDVLVYDGGVMPRRLLKSLALWSIAKGANAPGARVDRFTELVHLRNLLRALDANCVLDVGANRGQYARELRGIGYDGHIISFEPVAEEFAAMSALFAADRLWKGYQLALGAEDRKAIISIPRLTVMSSLLNPLDKVSPVTRQEVEMKRLDALLPQLVAHIHSPRIFLKIDTQGFDTEVFKGAEGSLKDIVGLQSELSIQPLYEDMPTYLQALNLYASFGFELCNVSVVGRVSGGCLLEMNCFMKRS